MKNTMTKLVSFKKLILLLIVSTILSACTSMPLGTMWKLRNFDPLSAEPTHIRFAVITDKHVNLADGSTLMTLSFKAQDPSHSFTHIAKASIKENHSMTELDYELSSQQKVTVFYFAEEDAESLRLTQSKLRNIKALDIEGEGSLTINVAHGCITGTLDQKDKLLVTIFAQFDPQQGYVKMISAVDILKEVDQTTRESWTKCDTAGDAFNQS